MRMNLKYLFKDTSNKEMKKIYQDLVKSKKEKQYPESLKLYLQAIKESFSTSTPEALEIAEEQFMKETLKRMYGEKDPQLPKVLGAGLLSLAEVKQMNPELLKASVPQEELESNYWHEYAWYLCSPGYIDDLVTTVSGRTGHINEIGYNAYSNEGLRPALHISDLSSSDLKVGDKLQFGEYDFTIVSDQYALCDKIVSDCRYKLHREDSYEESKAKERIDQWFAQQNEIQFRMEHPVIKVVEDFNTYLDLTLGGNTGRTVLYSFSTMDTENKVSVKEKLSEIYNGSTVYDTMDYLINGYPFKIWSDGKGIENGTFHLYSENKDMSFEIFEKVWHDLSFTDMVQKIDEISGNRNGRAEDVKKVKIDSNAKRLDISNIENATLLSTEEAASIDKDFLKMEKEELSSHKAWWLRSPYSDRNAFYDKVAACVRGTDGNFHGCAKVDKYLGVRLALKITDMEDLQIGDKVCFGDKTFTIVSDQYALCDDFIGWYRFHQGACSRDSEYAIADEYEYSDVKKMVDIWFERAKIMESEFEKDEYKDLDDDYDL